MLQKENNVDLGQYNNSWYKPGYKIKIGLWIIVSQLFVNTYFPYPTAFKRLILKLFGAKLGENIVIKQKVNIKYPWFLKIGDNTWIGERVWIDNLGKVTIGANVCLSQGSYLMTGNHDYKSKTFNLLIKEIIIEDGVWIGAKSIVCPGVKCGSHSILTVNSVATENMEKYMIYQGNPSVVKRKRIID